MLSRGARIVHRFTAVAYFGFGAILFLAPAWAAERFPWSVSPFVTMTIGGWCVGVTAFSWIGARHAPFGAVLPVLAFAWLFGLTEIVVVLLDKPIFDTKAPLAVPYVLSLAMTLVGGGFGLLEIAHQARAGRSLHGEHEARVAPGVRATLALLAVLLVLLAAGATVAGRVSPATSGRFFPEPVTLFTVRAFAALNVAMAGGAYLAALTGQRAATAWLGLATIFLVGPTLAAALANLGTFDFDNRPFGFAYVGGYAALLALAAAFAWRHRDALTHDPT